MKILVCDTSNSTCCAGVYEDGREIAYKLSLEKRTHSETFMPLVHEVMREANIAHQDLDAYAVTVGPGSFTGVRIGLSAVKAMALAAGKGCIPVSSTEALARSVDNATVANSSETLIVPAFDARNNRVFAQAAEDDTAKTLVKEDAYDADDLVKQILAVPEIIYGKRNQIIVVGDGADTMKAAFERAGAHINVYYAKGAAILPRGIAEAAFAKGEAGIISGRDVEASYCAASRVKTLKEQQNG
ncbi:MAG: tRNA (adenosine(37)-N6)-threonylcarbamoyltransferase complex dimerization subunit type 1 TsaB [Clostridiales bacterium]|nr:tRNA (adenosine(37)-N6)-threonylcarbamoyltransferase complex dimerization subunit type 1 TsaB [Clostridiales bacterium]